MFSVLIPLYNGIELLKEAVDSVRAQTYPEWEVIIGVNGHPQGSDVYKEALALANAPLALANAPSALANAPSALANAPLALAESHIRVIDLYDLPEKGKSAALNAMLPYAKFSHIAILDADDIWLPTKLEKQLPFVKEGYDVVGTQCEYFGELEGRPTIPLGDISSRDFFQANPMINSSAIVKKDLCHWVSHWDGVEDYDMWLRLRKGGRRFYNVGEVLVRHRIHRSSAFNAQGNGNKVPALLAEHTPKYRIRIFCSFGDSSQCKGIYERLCQTDKMPNYGPDKDIYITNDEDYTHAMILNLAMPPLNIPKENVIGFAFEPTPFIASGLTQEFISYAQKHVGRYYIGDASGLPAPFVTGYCYQWHVTPPENPVWKDRLMSIMVSDKMEAPGHQYRHTLVKAILASDLNIDIYGRGCRVYTTMGNGLDGRLKGVFTDDEPYEHYHFHICIENFSLPDYTSEKYTNTVLWGTTPIYWGAKNAVFPEQTVRLSGNIDQDMALIRDILHRPAQYKREFDQEKVRGRLSLLKHLDEVFPLPI
jgi:teichuronic acid biosynthesis glycosyltransferase TuaG